MRRIGLLAGAVAVALPASVTAETVITISKSQQKLAVTVDGAELYRWPVSTGRRGLDTPSGTFRPIRFERKWYSRQYDWSPMPYSIFFHGGYALHGTTEKRRLGQAASHGCVRLLPANAATLFSLVRREGKEDTRIVVTDAPLPPLERLILSAENVPLPVPRASSAGAIQKVALAPPAPKAAITVPLPPVHEPVFETPVAVAAVTPAPQAAITVPLPPVHEPVFETPVAVAAVTPAPQAAITVPLPPVHEPVFETPVAVAAVTPAPQAAITVPLPPLHEPVFETPVVVAAVTPAPQAAITVPLPPVHEPVFETPVVVAAVTPAPQAQTKVPLPPVHKPLFEEVATVEAEAKPPTQAMTAQAHVPLPRLRAPAARAKPPAVRVAQDGPFTSVGTEAEVMRGRAAWLRSLDRRYGIVR